MPTLLQTLFSGPARIARARGRIRRGAPSSRRPVGRTGEAGQPGFESLEPRAMLAANDIVVSLVGNRVSLALDPEGAAITNLSTAYEVATGVLTITAATAGTISTETKSPIPGITINTAADTIAVNLKTLTKFAGISVIGRGGTDSITIGRAGVNLGSVIRGAAAQGVSIDTDAGSDDRIMIAGPIVTKGAGAVSLATQGRAAMHGILLVAGTSAPGGSQTLAGAVNLLGDVAIRAGGDITFASTVDGAGRLHLAAGRAIAMNGDVGSMLPLQGITVATASRVTVSRGLSLDGAGTGAGMSGLVIGAKVHNVVFSTIPSIRTISGFSGAGIRFLGGSQGSRIMGVTSTGNGIGLQLGPGSYARTVISGNSFSGNATAGVSLSSAQAITIGGATPGAGNSIVSNGRFGITASGVCAGSLVVGNEIGDNPLGQVENLLASQLVGTMVIHNGTGLQLQLTEVGRASYLAQKARTYAFDVTFKAFAVSARSTGRLDMRSESVAIDTSVGFDTFPPQATYAPGPQPDALGTNRVITGLTPLKTLPGIEFPKSVRFVGSDASGKRYQAVVGLSTFVGMLPLADLENVPITVYDDSPVTVDVWVNAQGYASRISGSFEGGTFNIALRSHGTTWAIPGTTSGVLASPARLTAGLGVLSTATAANALLPGPVNGVSGVQAGRSTLSIPYGAGYQAPVDWYFPTQVDGTVQAQGVIWLQHAFGATGGAYSDLAAQLAQQTNSIVVAPTLPSIAPANSPGWWLPGNWMAQAVASLFAGERSALKASAVAAGYTGDTGELSGKFVLAGHSAGGGFATAVAADYAASHENASALAGVIMYDGVSAGAFDDSGRFAQQLASLDARTIPLYQLAAPAQLWNAYGATTNALLEARPGRFNGVVLTGGSHVDAMLGGDPRADFIAQRITKMSSSGNAAAIHTLSAGWINDLYAGATPESGQYGLYPSTNQPIIMGTVAAAALPSPIANTLSPGDRRLAAEIDAIGGLSGFLSGQVINTGTNGISTTVSPAASNGVTGVKTGTAPLNIPCGTSGYPTTADWYFPTQIDGRVLANAVIWLQGGDLGSSSSFATLATAIARQTNSVVVVPTISAFETATLPGRFLGSAAMQAAAASMFVGARGALNLSASAAGSQGQLPRKFLLAGHTTGGGFATSVASLTVDNGARTNLLGVVMFDGVADSVPFAASVATLANQGIPVYQIASPPQASNAQGRTTRQLVELRPDQFIGVQIDSASPGDVIRTNRWAGQGSTNLTGPSSKDIQNAAIAFATGWVNDLYSDTYNAKNPYYGIYGNPNDGTYTWNQFVTMGRVRATVLPVTPPV